MTPQLPTSRLVNSRRPTSAPRARAASTLAAASLLLAACSERPRESAAAPPLEHAAVVAAIGEEYAEHLAEISPYVKFRRGERVTSLPRKDLAASEELAAFADDLLVRLETVDPAALAHQDWLSLELLRWDLDLLREAPQHYWASFDITPYAGGGFELGVVHQIFASHPLAEEGERANYQHLLLEYGRLIRQLGDKVVGQKERGIYLPKAQVPNVRGLFEGYRSRLGELLTPTAERLAKLEPAPREAFVVAIEDAIASEVQPQFTRLLAELGDDYEEAAPEQVGLAVVPGGPALYRYRVRQHTTTELSPEEVHQIGLEEVAAIEQQMKALRQELGFEASSEETAMQEFLAAMRSDPRFIASSPEQVEERYMGYIARIEPLIANYFDALPAAPYGVRRLDPTAEATMTFGVYRPPTPENPRGEYHYNGSDLANRSLFSAQGLIYHELIPGHHFQVALTFENQELPRFRREGISYAAYTEGWAEYAANLAKEMGLYSDPYDLYGRLAMEMFVACRLVVDTGLNRLGWTLEQAREYLRQRIVYSDVEIATELLRYSADIHGQALGYRMGSREITRLRQEAEQALGERFDLKAFHHAVIGYGAMPLLVLEKHLDWWIQQQSGTSGEPGTSGKPQELAEADETGDADETQA